MKEFFKKSFFKDPKNRKIVGIVFVIVGFISIITPFTPVGILFFVGLEILGVRTLFWDKIKNWFRKSSK